MTDILFSPISLSDLDLLIQKSVRRVFLERSEFLPVSEPPDRCTLADAINITGLSKSQLYKFTFAKKIPFQKFGKKLIFSRKELLSWMEEKTISIKPDGDIITKRLQISAEKKIK